MYFIHREILVCTLYTGDTYMYVYVFYTQGDICMYFIHREIYVCTYFIHREIYVCTLYTGDIRMYIFYTQEIDLCTLYTGEDTVRCTRACVSDW